MTPKKNYSRYFIILQEDEKGYSLEADKIPSGYAKLEMKNNKCKISYYVQNLRKEKQPYYMILICGKKDVNKIIKLGKLNIDDYGRLDISHEYDIENIADTGISAEKIIGAAIVKFLDTNVVSIMSGFSTTDKPTEWRNYKLADFNKEKKETRTEDIVNEFDEYEQSIELIKVQSDEKDDVVLEHLENQKNVDEVLDTIQRANVESVKKDESLESVKIIGKAEKVETLINVEKDEEVEKVENVEKVEALKRVEKIEKVKNVELNEVESDKKADEIVQQLEAEKNVHEEIDTRISEEVANSNKLKRDIRENVIKEDMDTDKNKEQYKKDNYNMGENYARDDYPKGAMGDFFKAVAKDFDEVSDFSKEIKWCRWHKVPVNSLENMYDFSDYNKYTIAYYPMISYYSYIRNYKYFMLGFKCDSSGKMKYIVYGIPGSRAKADQPYGGKTGFVTWIQDKDSNEMGHWLMFYDFKKSTIVVPIKK